jgi:hypothetical protein
MWSLNGRRAKQIHGGFCHEIIQVAICAESGAY